MFKRLAEVFRPSKADVLDAKCKKLLAEKRAADTRLKKRIKEVNKFQAQMERKLSKIYIELKNARIVNEKLEESLTATREELKTANNIVIPGLVAANQTFIDRWDAESRIQKLRMSTPTEPTAPEAF